MPEKESQIFRKEEVPEKEEEEEEKMEPSEETETPEAEKIPLKSLKEARYELEEKEAH